MPITTTMTATAASPSSSTSAYLDASSSKQHPQQQRKVPQYPSLLEILQHAAIRMIRAPTLAVLATYAVFPLYEQLRLWVTVTLGLPDLWVMVLGTFLAHTITFYLFAVPFHLCDVYGWMSSYRIPRARYELPTPGLTRRAILYQLFGHFITQIPWIYFTHEYIANFPRSDAPLPSLKDMWLFYWYALVMHEVGFYTAHRTFHAFPTAYKWIHKVHHQFVGSTVWATEHTHQVELILGGIGAHQQFSGMHILLWMVWLMWRTQDSCEHHSGYCFKGTFLSRLGLLNAYRTEFHDWHHTHPVSGGNFGTHLGLDFLLRTSDTWMLELEKRREQEATCVEKKKASKED